MDHSNDFNQPYFHFVQNICIHYRLSWNLNLMICFFPQIIIISSGFTTILWLKCMIYALCSKYSRNNSDEILVGQLIISFVASLHWFRFDKWEKIWHSLKCNFKKALNILFDARLNSIQKCGEFTFCEPKQTHTGAHSNFHYLNQYSSGSAALKHHHVIHVMLVIIKNSSIFCLRND